MAKIGKLSHFYTNILKRQAFCRHFTLQKQAPVQLSATLLFSLMSCYVEVVKQNGIPKNKDPQPQETAEGIASQRKERQCLLKLVYYCLA
jgi:hypothetical protein